MMTEPAAIHASSPIETGATNALSTPVLTLLPIDGPLLRPRGVILVHGDVPGGDVRVRADVGVADVREMRHLRPLTDEGVLDLHERAGLGACLENRAGAKVTERSHESAFADDRVVEHGVRPDLGPRRDPRGPSDDRERMDDRVGLEHDSVVDPG